MSLTDEDREAIRQIVREEAAPPEPPAVTEAQARARAAEKIRAGYAAQDGHAVRRQRRNKTEGEQ